MYTLKYSSTIDNKIVVLEDYIFDGIKVEEGFVSNGGDIPRIFWLFTTPHKAKYLPCYVVHDHLCELELYDVADCVLEEMLLIAEKEKHTIITRGIIFFVKLYHRIKYGK